MTPLLDEDGNPIIKHTWGKNYKKQNVNLALWSRWSPGLTSILPKKAGTMVNMFSSKRILSAITNDPKWSLRLRHLPQPPLPACRDSWCISGEVLSSPDITTETHFLDTQQLRCVSIGLTLNEAFLWRPARRWESCCGRCPWKPSRRAASPARLRRFGSPAAPGRRAEEVADRVLRQSCGGGFKSLLMPMKRRSAFQIPRRLRQRHRPAVCSRGWYPWDRNVVISL